MKYTILVLLLFISSFALASENNVESNYTDNYIKQMTPVLINTFKKITPEKSSTEIEGDAKKMAVKMAKCQFESVDHYPENYWKQAIIPISQGENIGSSNSMFDDLLTKDLESGNITEEQFINMVQKAQMKVMQCIQS